MKPKEGFDHDQVLCYIIKISVLNITNNEVLNYLYKNYSKVEVHNNLRRVAVLKFKKKVDIYKMTNKILKSNRANDF